MGSWSGIEGEEERRHLGLLMIVLMIKDKGESNVRDAGNNIRTEESERIIIFDSYYVSDTRLNALHVWYRLNVCVPAPEFKIHMLKSPM